MEQARERDAVEKQGMLGGDAVVTTTGEEEESDDGEGDVGDVAPPSTAEEAWDAGWERKLQEHLRQRGQRGDNDEAAAEGGGIRLEAKWSTLLRPTTSTTTAAQQRPPSSAADEEDAWWRWWAEEEGEGGGEGVVVVVTEDGGVSKRIVRPGTGARPVVGCKVAVNYVGRLWPSKELFDQAHATKPLVIELGQGEALPGMEAALAGMEKGEEAVVTIAPAHAYGDVGCPPRIPPRSHVQFLLRLLYIEWPTSRGVKQRHLHGDPLEQRMANADRERESGNDQFRLKAYRKAVRCYNKGLATFNGLHLLTEEEQAHLNTSLLPLHANLAAALYHLQDYPKAIENARKALAIDPKHEKAMYRLGLAHEALHDHDQAQDVYRRLAGMRPESALYRQALVRIQGVEREALKRSIFVGLFNKPHEQQH